MKPMKKTFDGFVNFMSSLGLGANNQFSGGRYKLGPFLSRDRIQLEAMYRGNWIAGQIVDTIAEDMTRAGISIQSQMPPDDIAAIDKEIGELDIWGQLCQSIKWARLYGGCIAYIAIDGQRPDTPLNLDSIREGQFKGLFPFDRWLLWPSLSELITELGPNLGKPKFYTVVGDSPALPGIKMHHTRCIRFDGITLPYYQALSENGWGESVIERMHDRLVAFDSATAGVSQLVFKAHLRGVGVKGFREALSAGGDAEQAVIKQFEYVRLMQSNEGLTLLDSEDQFWAQQYSFSGLSDILLRLEEQVSGATEIPLVRLFGQSPAGLNSTGESDLRNHYDHVNALQNKDLRLAWSSRLFPILSASVLGKPLPPDFSFDFNPLWQLDDKDRVGLARELASAVVELKNSGIFSQRQCLAELKQSSAASNVFTNILDEDIAKASNEIESFGDMPGLGGEDDESTTND